VKYIPENHGMDWRQDEEQALVKGCSAGLSLTDIAQNLGRSPASVRQKLAKLGLEAKSENTGASVGVVDQSSPMSDELRQALASFGASTRLRSTLQRRGIRAVDELMALDRRSLIRMSQVGRKTVLEIQSLQSTLFPGEQASTARIDVVNKETVQQIPISEDNIVQQLDYLVVKLERMRVALKSDEVELLKIHKEIARSFTRFDNSLMRLLRSDSSVDELPLEQSAVSYDDDDDPLPDRFCSSLAELVRACVPDLKDRFVTLRILGLEKGEPALLREVGKDLGVSRERIRQRKVRALKLIYGSIKKRHAACLRVQDVMGLLANDGNWSNPEFTAGQILRLVSDRFQVMKELTKMCCLASGWSGNANELEAGVAAAVNLQRDIANENGSFGEFWAQAASVAIFPGGRRPFKGPPNEFLDRKREPGNMGDGEPLLFQSNKLGRSVSCESLGEYRAFRWLEEAPEVEWYQEQPTVLSYQWGNHTRNYYPDAAVLDRQGYCYLIEIKPQFYMYRIDTLVKSLACLRYAAKHAMGYLLIDSFANRSLSDYATVPYDIAAADEIDELIFRHAEISFSMVRKVFADRQRKLTNSEFSAMIINRDWSVTRAPGVTIARLPEGVSFRPLLAHREA
jgi:hypothetical protein